MYMYFSNKVDQLYSSLSFAFHCQSGKSIMFEDLVENASYVMPG